LVNVHRHTGALPDRANGDVAIEHAPGLVAGVKDAALRTATWAYQSDQPAGSDRRVFLVVWQVTNLSCGREI
jgi:hypothetical protein